MFNVVEFIEDKRDGIHHTKQAIDAFVNGVTDGSVPDYQLSAWLMAAFLNGLSEDETISLTEALAHSGAIISYPKDQKVIDKHSTGGVGDKTTLVLIPLVASCGAKISKLSGPGLGYTGGTVDKLESIPGMNVRMGEEAFKNQVEKIGCAISGHSHALAPTEGKFYRLRDVTGTVPSVPLIVSSILSKKLAGGAYGYLFDVKSGSGAFMHSEKDATELAQELVKVSRKLGKKCAAVISDMDQPLGEWVGNAAEIMEAVSVMKGNGPADTHELCVTLGGYMLKLAEICGTVSDGEALCNKALRDGSALNKFAELIKMQGGDAGVTEKPEDILPAARKIYDVKANESGYISELNALKIGEALRALGGGRLTREEKIDPSVAVRLFAKVGTQVNKGDNVLSIYYNEQRQLDNAMGYIEGAWKISPSFVEKRQLIIDKVE